jgi:exodeoxyribonuclease V beta subunit
VLHHRYDVQYALYTLALHRLLSARLGSTYDYDTHMGGAIYLFLRGVDAEGHGVFVRRMPYAAIEALEKSVGGAAS